MQLLKLWNNIYVSVENKRSFLEYSFCPLCGHSLVERNLDHRVRNVCPDCGFVHYMNPAPAAAVICEQEGRVLLVKRKFEPKAGDWSLPAGFVEYAESPKETAVRETKEETGLDVNVLQLFGVYGSCDDPRTRVVLVVYHAQIVGGELQAGDDAIEARFFPRDQLPANVAFSSHQRALDRFIAENHS
jgi:8-oxo-dGTP diphosphatase